MTPQKFKQTEIGKIPTEWEVKTTEDVMEIITDFVANGSFASLAENVKYYEEPKEAILIRLADYNNNFLNKFVYIDEKGYNFLKKSKLLGGEIIISNVGAYAGTVFRTPKLNRKMTLGPNSIMMNSKTSNDFYFYWFLSPLGQASIKTILTGSANPKFNKTDFRKLNVPLPPLPEQHAIAQILSSLDEKIELNNKMNKTLEAIGQVLFKKWFIDNPEKEGWEEGKLGNYIDLEKGLSYKGAGLTDNKNKIPMANLGTFNLISGFKKEGLKYYCGEYRERHLVKPGDLIIANTDMTQSRDILGSPAIIPLEINSEKVLFTHHTYAVRHKENSLSNYFLYFLFQTQKYRERAIGFATGTTVLALPKEAILNMKFHLPSKEILDKLDRFAKNIFNRLSTNNQQNQTLAQIRDALLPKLMNGEIRVPVKDGRKK
jgi:type I restriction enzyme, S subunit